MASPSAIISFLEGQRQRLLDREEAELQRLALRWKEIEARLESEIQLQTERMAQRKAQGKAITDSAILQLDTTKRLLLQVRDELRQFAELVDREIQTQQEQMIRDAAGDVGQILELAGIMALPQLSTRAVERMVGLAGDGSPLRDHLDDAYPEASARMLELLIQNTALGINPNTTARRMMQEGLGSAFERMARVTRTEQLRAYREASLDQYRASGVVVAYRRLARKSSRTCLACLLADGETYPIEQAFPTHVCCRCSFVPVVRGAPMITWTEGREWFLGQPESVQREMLGPQRWAAWQADRFDLSQLVARRDDAIWGPQIRVTRVKDLRR